MSKDEPSFDWRAFTPEDSPKTPMEMMADPVHRDLATAKLALGDRAFGFDLPIFDFSDGTERTTGGQFHLHDIAAGRPVALVFGSYT